MVLPLPIKPGSGEDAVRFINLEAYPDLFDDMHKGFPEPRSYGAKSPVAVAAPRSRTLEVHTVGAFEASYVPTPADFSRLSRRFRLPDGTWEKLPGYAGFGFAVFKLKQGNRHVHPMSFSFPTAMPDKLFFPTLHIHDGEVHEKAEFDHTLYCQTAKTPRPDWSESPQLALQFMKAGETQGIVLPNEHIYRRKLYGELANTDWLVKARAVA